MRDADPSSIECIQSRAPGLSRSDFDFVEERMRSGELFPGITDPRRRSDLALRLLTTKELIPSLWTLICDIRYLKRPAMVLNTLLPPKEPRGRLGINNSLRERFLAHWKTRVASRSRCSGLHRPSPPSLGTTWMPLMCVISSYGFAPVVSGRSSMHTDPYS
jgi:hypothetical protein